MKVYFQANRVIVRKQGGFVSCTCLTPGKQYRCRELKSRSAFSNPNQDVGKGV